jgi:hypothetical protein
MTHCPVRFPACSNPISVLPLPVPPPMHHVKTGHRNPSLSPALQGLTSIVFLLLSWVCPEGLRLFDLSALSDKSIIIHRLFSGPSVRCQVFHSTRITVQWVPLHPTTPSSCLMSRPDTDSFSISPGLTLCRLWIGWYGIQIRRPTTSA